MSIRRLLQDHRNEFGAEQHFEHSTTTANYESFEGGTYDKDNDKCLKTYTGSSLQKYQPPNNVMPNNPNFCLSKTTSTTQTNRFAEVLGQYGGVET